ncbi:hypothetical protein HID58_043473, partial [Brassica napus]
SRETFKKKLPKNKFVATEDEELDESVLEVNGGDYNEDGREVSAIFVNLPGRLLLNATSGTHFYFRQRQTQVRLSSDLGVGDVNCSTSSTKYEGVKKIEVVTVFELNAYVVNSTPQVKSLTVSSSILAGATYPALMGSLPACSDLTSVGVVRYRVELCISDGTESAVFVVFYAEISWLTNVRAAVLVWETVGAEQKQQVMSSILAGSLQMNNSFQELVAHSRRLAQSSYS